MCQERVNLSKSDMLKYDERFSLLFCCTSIQQLGTTTDQSLTIDGVHLVTECRCCKTSAFNSTEIQLVVTLEVGTKSKHLSIYTANRRYRFLRNIFWSQLKTEYCTTLSDGDDLIIYKQYKHFIND